MQVTEKTISLAKAPDAFGANMYTKLDVMPQPNGTVSLVEFCAGFNPLMKEIMTKRLQLRWVGSIAGMGGQEFS